MVTIPAALASLYAPLLNVPLPSFLESFRNLLYLASSSSSENSSSSSPTSSSWILLASVPFMFVNGCVKTKVLWLST